MNTESIKKEVYDYMNEGKNFEVKIRPEKTAVVDQMKEKLSGAKGAVLVSYNKLSVKDATALRRKFREHGVEYAVIKNTLTHIAADELGMHELASQLEGPNGLAISTEDPVAAAAALKEFLKENKTEAIQVKAGLVEGKFISAKEVAALADLPSREQLLAMVCGTMLAPVTGLAQCMQGTVRNFVYALDAVRKQKEEGSQATA
jgi:large subunit ribosomal protein L10